MMVACSNVQSLLVECYSWTTVTTLLLQTLKEWSAAADCSLHSVLQLHELTQYTRTHTSSSTFTATCSQHCIKIRMWRLMSYAHTICDATNTKITALTANELSRQPMMSLKLARDQSDRSQASWCDLALFSATSQDFSVMRSLLLYFLPLDDGWLVAVDTFYSFPSFWTFLVWLFLPFLVWLFLPFLALNSTISSP